MNENAIANTSPSKKTLRLIISDFHLDWGGQAAVVHLLCRHFCAFGCEVAVAAPEGSELQKRSQEEGWMTVRGLRFLPGFRPWAFWRDLALLRRYFRDFAPHVIHVHGSQDSWLAAIANCFIGAAVVKTKHNTRPVRRHIFNRWLYRSLCHHCVAVSNSAAQTLADLVPPERLTIIPAPVDEAFFETPPRLDLRNALGLPAEALLVGQVARLSHLKGQDVFIDAAPLVMSHAPLARFVLVGTGEDYHRLQDRIRQKGLTHHMFLLGFRRDIAAVMANFQVAVLPSVEPEGSPVAIKEAMALGIPVVATDVGGNSEIVEHGRTGILVPPADPNALAEAIISLLADRNLAMRLGKAGQQSVRERFCAPAIARQYFDLFQKVAEI